MKDTIKNSFSKLLSDRYLFTLCVLMILLSIVFAIYIGFSVRYSELQLVSHYSVFGVTHFYRDQWYYLLSFGVFGLGVSAIHGALIAKILVLKDRNLALLIAWSTIAMIILCWMCASSVINIWSPS